MGRAVAEGQADTGIALLAVAEKYELDFVPLFVERFDLVFPSTVAGTKEVQPLLNHLQAAGLHRLSQTLADTSQPIPAKHAWLGANPSAQFIAPY